MRDVPKFPAGVFAHRGFSAVYPENTLVAFDQALKYPVDGLELDLQWTKDEVAVCFHDRTLHKVGGGKVAIRNRRFADLAGIDCGAWFNPPQPGQKLVRLEQVLDKYGSHTQLLLEIKRRELGNRRRMHGLMAEVIRQVCERGLEDQVWLLCFDLDTLRWGHRLNTNIRFMLNQSKPTLIEDDAFLSAYDVQTRALNSDFVKAIQQRGKLVFCYTVNHRRDLERMLRMGVDGIMTDNPAWLLEEIRSMG